MAKVLLVDDDELVLYTLGKFLQKSGHEIIEASDGLEAKKILDQESVDILVTDLIMPNVEGLELQMTTRKLYPNMPVIVMSGGSRYVDTRYLINAKLLGAFATLEKPFDEQELLKLIEGKAGSSIKCL